MKRQILDKMAEIIIKIDDHGYMQKKEDVIDILRDYKARDFDALDSSFEELLERVKQEVFSPEDIVRIRIAWGLMELL